MGKRLALVVVVVLAAGCGFHRVAAPAARPDPAAQAATDPEGSLRAIWIGHATVLLRIGDRWVLTDPVFRRWVSATKRFVAPGVAARDLPALDWVLISHAHIDHLDPKSLRALPAGARLGVPRGLLATVPGKLPRMETSSVAWWDMIDDDGLHITAVPARHPDGRWHVDTLWRDDTHGGWVVEHAGFTVYFAGDTGFDETLFRDLGERWDIDVALLPVGPIPQSTVSRWFWRERHMDPQDAMRALALLDARFMVPIHHSTFPPGEREEWRRVATAVAAHPLAGRVAILRPGQSLFLRDPIGR